MLEALFCDGLGTMACFKVRSDYTYHRFIEREITMTVPENGLTNHEVTVCLAGGAVLGPFNATWSKDSGGDVRELVREYDAFLQVKSSTATSSICMIPTQTRFIP